LGANFDNKWAGLIPQNQAQNKLISSPTTSPNQLTPNNYKKLEPPSSHGSGSSFKDLTSQITKRMSNLHMDVSFFSFIGYTVLNMYFLALAITFTFKSKPIKHKFKL
jgi:hypothetical protein